MSLLAGRLFAALALLGVAVPFDVGMLQLKLDGEVRVDGSTQVFRIAEAMAAEFPKKHPKVTIDVQKIGSGGGLQRLAAGEIHIATASRPITAAEIASCQAFEVDYLEMQVAWDAVAVVAHKDNTWASKLTVEQLKRIWHADDGNVKVAKKWSDLDPKWPKQEIKLAGAGARTGLCDLFTKSVIGKGGTIRDDYEQAKTNFDLPPSLADDKYALGFIGHACWQKRKDDLKTLAIAFQPDKYTPLSPEGAAEGTYLLARPLFIYVNKAALKEPQVLGFVAFHFQRGDLVQQAGYMELSAKQRKEQQEKLVKAVRADQ
jgi:phosphate transport system substrate-binding protein